MTYMKPTPRNVRDYDTLKSQGDKVSTLEKLVRHDFILSHIRREVFNYCEFHDIYITANKVQSVEFILKYPFTFPESVVRRAKKVYKECLDKLIRSYRNQLEEA